MFGLLKWPMKEKRVARGKKKPHYVIERGRETGDAPSKQLFVAKFHYEDDECELEMLLTAEEADIYQNAVTRYEKEKQRHPDSKVHQHWRAQKFLSLHEHFGEQIRKYYSIPGCLEKAVEYCQLQIQYAPVALRAFRDDPFTTELPEHPGYHYLVRIREKEGKYGEALYLAKLAGEEGWKGDWETRAMRLREKMRQHAG